MLGLKKKRLNELKYKWCCNWFFCIISKLVLNIIVKDKFKRYFK